VTGTAPTLRGRVHQNLYLPAGSQEVQALVTVEATGAEPAEPAAAPEAAEVVVVDTSGSMAYPADKIRCAVDATATAIDQLRDGVHFAVVAGTDGARMVYPAAPVTERADDRTRAAAKAAVRGLVAGGGTAISTWLRMTSTLLARHPQAIRHAILLTDGRNAPSDPLAAAVAECEGTFRCDCRGVGVDWSATELRTIARGLLGSFDKIAEPAAMAVDFRTLMAASMRKEVAEIALRVWMPVGARVGLVKQTAPDIVDLTARRVADGAHVGFYPTGAWGTEERDFHVSVEVPPAGVDQEKLACRISFVQLLPDGSARPLDQDFVRSRPDGRSETHFEALVSAIWTDDPGRDTAPHPLVLASHDQKAVEEAVDRAAAAYEAGDHTVAGEWLDAVRPLAERAGRRDVVARIDGLRDPETGTYRFTDEGVLDLQIDSSHLPAARPSAGRRKDRPGA
jgi:hypothetical protein